MATINALSLPTLTDLLDLMIVWRKQYGQNSGGFPVLLFFALNVLRTPEFHSVHTLPKKFKTKYADHLANWMSANKDMLHFTESNDMMRLIDLLRTEIDEVQRQRQEVDFKRFYTQFDQRRGKDFVGTFDDEIVEWYKNIPKDYPS